MREGALARDTIFDTSRAPLFHLHWRKAFISSQQVLGRLAPRATAPDISDRSLRDFVLRSKFFGLESITWPLVDLWALGEDLDNLLQGEFGLHCRLGLPSSCATTRTLQSQIREQ